MEEIHELSGEVGVRLSNKQPHVKGCSCPACRRSSSGKKQFAQDVAASKKRTRERNWVRETVKAHNAGAELPKEPSPVISGMYRD